MRKGVILSYELEREWEDCGTWGRYDQVILDSDKFKNN